MDFVAHLLSKSLRERNPQLDLWGSDKRVLWIAYQDLMNCLKVHWKLVGKEGAETELREKIHFCFHEKPRELEEFVHLWSGIWMKKWGERVKLTLGREDSKSWRRANRVLAKAEPVWSRLRDRHEVMDLVIETLVRNGEICGTSILAEDLLKMELGLYTDKKLYAEGRERLLAAVNNVLRKVKKMARSRGPLVFIRLDRRFFRLLKGSPEQD